MTPEEQENWIQDQYEKEEERINKLKEEEEVEKMALAMTFGALFGLFY